MTRLPTRTELVAAYAKLAARAAEVGLMPEVADIAPLSDAEVMRLGRELRIEIALMRWMDALAAGFEAGDPDFRAMSPSELANYDRTISANLAAVNYRRAFRVDVWPATPAPRASA